VRIDVAGDLLARQGAAGDEVLERRGRALEPDGLRVGDVAGDVLQREGLRLQTRNRSGERVEDTHDEAFSIRTRAVHDGFALWPHCRDPRRKLRAMK
jgi:hypothetical protein